MSDHAQIGEQTVSDHARREGNRRRAAKSREKRQEAGQTRISAWVPRERVAYAHQVLQAVVAGGNALPPDPEQTAALDMLQTELDQVRAVATRREAELANERDTANTRARAAEQERDEVRRALQAAEATAAQAQAVAERFQQAPGLRGRMIRWLAR